jgi:hypothetical protein
MAVAIGYTLAPGYIEPADWRKAGGITNNRSSPATSLAKARYWLWSTTQHGTRPSTVR